MWRRIMSHHEKKSAVVVGQLSRTRWFLFASQLGVGAALTKAIW